MQCTCPAEGPSSSETPSHQTALFFLFSFLVAFARIADAPISLIPNHTDTASHPEVLVNHSILFSSRTPFHLAKCNDTTGKASSQETRLSICCLRDTGICFMKALNNRFFWSSSLAPKATAYGECVSTVFGDIQKDSCAKEFEAFRQCVTKSVCGFLV